MDDSLAAEDDLLVNNYFLKSLFAGMISAPPSQSKQSMFLWEWQKVINHLHNLHIDFSFRQLTLRRALYIMHDLTPDPYLGTGVLENLLFKPKKLVTVSLLLLVDYL